MTFRVGQRIVCIHAFTTCTYDEIAPTVGNIYTVRDIRASFSFEGEAVIRLVEIRNAPQLYQRGLTECWWGAVGFRPLIERTTDISFAHEILRKVCGGVDA